MKFDKSRVYTAVNADELQIGSKCIFADTVKGLRRKVEEDADCVETFYRLHNNGGDDLFVGNDCAYCYACIIESPAEPKYKPFESINKVMEAIKKRGEWLKHKTLVSRLLITGVDDGGCYLGDTDFWSFKVLFQYFVFADDGSPCGELVES